MSTVSDTSILFGGRDNLKFYQDLWKFQHNSDTNYVDLYYNWTQLDAKGIYPAPRAGHSAGVQGNYIIIAGGYDENGNILSDYWLLETSQMKWTQIIPNQNSDTPPALINTCIVVDLPYFYIIGGRSVTGLTFDFWQYSFTNNEFYLLRPTQKTDIPLSKHTCALSIEKNIKYIYVSFGSKSIDDNPYCGITRFNLADLNNVRVEIITTKVKSFTCRTDSVLAFLGGYLFGFGGQSFSKKAFNDVFIISLKSHEEEYYDEILDKPLYNSAYTLFGNKIFFYSGLNNAYYPQIKPSNNIYSFNFTTENDRCGNGFIYNETSQSCIKCPLGTYSGIEDSICKPCDKGFFSNFSAASDITQCFPCPEGTYSNIEGSTACLDCEKNAYCPIGSSSASSNFNWSDNNIFPKIYQPKSNDEFTSLCLYCLIAVTILFIVPWFLFWRFRLFLSCFDIFKQAHYKPKTLAEEKRIRETEKEEYLLGYDEIFKKYMKENNIKYIGGFCTGFAFVVLLYLIAYYFGLFFIGNIYEIQGVEPASSLLQEKQALFLNNTISVHLSFNSYRGNCSIAPTVYSSLNFSVYKSIASLDYCSFIYNFRKEEMFVTGDNILFKFNQKNSFTSDITLYLESDSEVPGEKSGLFQSLNSTPSLVFRGNTPTLFYYGLTPAYFKETSLFDSFNENKGFRLSQISFPDFGSQHQINQIYFNPGLSIKINLIIEDSAIVTYRVPISDITTFVGSLLAELNGALGFLVVLMLFFILLQRWRYPEPDQTSGWGNYQELSRLYKIKKNTNSSQDRNIRDYLLQDRVNS